MSGNYSQYISLEQEAILYSHYLIGREPSNEMVKRYVHANQKLGIQEVDLSEKNILEFSINHPWSIPFLDAATGIIKPHSMLRKKIYTMAAVLEASPRYCGDFFPENISLFILIWNLVKHGLTAAMKIGIGIPMLIVVKRRSHD